MVSAMALLAHAPLLAALTLGAPPPDFALRVREAPDPASIVDETPADFDGWAETPRCSEAATEGGEGGQAHASDALSPPPPARKIGEHTTIFVNFDGVTLDTCVPSNSHANCSSIEGGETIDPFPGDLAQRVAILDGMRDIGEGLGLRITGQRPGPDETYLMLVYGGDSIAEEALGRAPAGDCYDDLPNQVGFVYLGTDRAAWINGGASTAMHEAAHTWGLDHVGLDTALMAPMGGNTIANYFDGCAQIVQNVELDPIDPGTASCPDLNLELCGLADFQYATALIEYLFGGPYVDERAPALELLSPGSGRYYQAPASFFVELGVVDDLHPQRYEFAVTIPGLVDEPNFSEVLDPSFEVENLPVGSWTFELRLRDMAGNEGTLSFEIEVGEDPPRLDDGCACAAVETDPRRSQGLGLALLSTLGGVWGLRRRRRRK